MAKRRLKVEIEADLEIALRGLLQARAETGALRDLIDDHWGKNGRALAADVNRLADENRKANARATAAEQEVKNLKRRLECSRSALNYALSDRDRSTDRRYWNWLRNLGGN